ncbi:MAG: hypothetical protein ACK50Q_17840 [Labrys sp. (in: a-proteobacteria)]|jgi:hypothetical protein
MFAVYENAADQRESLILVEQSTVPEFLAKKPWRKVAVVAEAARDVHLDVERHGYGLYHDGLDRLTHQETQPPQ